ncbi:MAG: hypothetical protein IPH09_09540 [bacterium]|nr:hypothetical protein [bacterium]
MKSHLDKNAHQLTDREREDLWRRIADAGAPRRRRPLLLPATGAVGTLAVAALVLLVMRNDPARRERLPPGRETLGRRSCAREVAADPRPGGRPDRANERETTAAEPVTPATRAEASSGKTAAVNAPAASSETVDVLHVGDESPPPDELTYTQEIVVEAEPYKVEVKNAATAQSIPGGTLRAYAIDSVEEARAKQAGRLRVTAAAPGPPPCGSTPLRSPNPAPARSPAAPPRPTASPTS